MTKGTEIAIGGIRNVSMGINEICKVLEKSTYMKDFEFSEDGRPTKINYERVD